MARDKSTVERSTSVSVKKTNKLWLDLWISLLDDLLILYITEYTFINSAQKIVADGLKTVRRVVRTVELSNGRGGQPSRILMGNNGKREAATMPSTTAQLDIFCLF